MFLPQSGAAHTPATPLTLQDCLRLAEVVPNTITLAQQERAIAEREVMQARAGLLPQTEVQNNFTYNSPSKTDRSTVSFIPLNALREYALLGTVTQEFDIGSGSRLLQPLAITVIGGVTVSLALSLLITPVLFYLLRKRGF